jgi:hypothetical protein
MAGSWLLDTATARVEGHWTTDGGAMMLGIGTTVPAKGKTSSEFLRIAEMNGKTALVAMPQGGAATLFPLKSSGDSRVVFENLAHDYPQAIIYWRAAEKLCARTEGTVDGKTEVDEWCFSRVP